MRHTTVGIPWVRKLVPQQDPERELIEAIGEWIPGLDGRVHPETPLFQSGQFDSLALFNLVMWIEDRIGAPVDASSLDPAGEWNTVAEIVRYIARAKGQG